MITNEYSEGNLAIREVRITFFYIPVFKYRKTSTNRQAVAILTPAKTKSKQIKGFV